METNRIPTAEEFLMSKVETRSKWVTDIMVEFAKLHVKAALEAAADKAELNEMTMTPDVKSILNAYPETLIK